MSMPVNYILDVLNASWTILFDAGFFIFLGFLIAGIIHAFISPENISKYLGGNRFRSVVNAALIGVPLPLCSCGVVPTAIALKKQGASKAATLSFLITTPESSVDSILLTYALIDPIMTVARPAAAFITGFVAGAAELLLGAKEEGGRIEEVVCPHCKEEAGHEHHRHNLAERFLGGMRFAFVDLFRDISRWFIVGILIAGVIASLIPATFVEAYLGKGWQSMLIMLAIGIPLYICAVASTPIAASLIIKGMSPGAGLVFLLAGPATNAASLVVITKTLGKRTAVIYLLSIAICAVILGMLLNLIYEWSGIDIRATIGHAHEMLPMWIKWVFAILMSIGMIVAAIKGPLEERIKDM